MSSKLFRAVVGVGISLGAASAACVASTEPSLFGNESSSGTDPTPEGETNPLPVANPPATPPPPKLDASHHDADATVDGGTDAVADAPTDALLSAFCDAAWPTTKGNPGGPTCGSVAACADAGKAPHCYPQVGSSSSSSGTLTCDFNTVPAWCVGGNWQCSSGAVPQDQCKCWQGSPCP